MRYSAIILLMWCLGALPAWAQWTNRYPRIAGYSHHVYLEGYELPTLTMGPIDPAPSPDGASVAFSSRGWIWLLDVETHTARRLTRGGAMDFRPAWSPDGAQLAFMRDDGSDTWIVVLDLAAETEQVVNTPTLELDPAFSADGRFLYYASAANGWIDVWRRALATGRDSVVVERVGLQLRPQPHPNGRHLVYLAKEFSNDIRLHLLGTGEEAVLQSERITSMTRPALSPDGETLVYNWPTQERYELRVLHLNDPTTSVLLTASDGLPLTPAWSADGQWIYFAEADQREVFHLKRIRVVGGPVETVPIHRWDWNEPTATVRVTTTDATNRPVAARLDVVDGQGHPVIPDAGQSRFDGQNGRVFFYSPGTIELTVPAGSVRVSAVQGLATPEASQTVQAKPGGVTEVTLALEPVWDARADGWISGDHHFHLNYGGPYQLTPDDLAPMMAGEALDVATPLLANLHNRFEDQRYWGWSSSGTAPLVRFGQEVRSHFLGHLGLLGITDLFWPWIWGPGYQVYGADDRPNTEALAHTRRQGGLSMYVHPFSGRDPMTLDGMRRVPVELVADGVLGAFDLLEVACLWSDEMGTSALWYRLLNIGVPIAPSGGTDVMNNFYRTMALGTTRVYAHTGGATGWPAYAEALRAGRSFVTTGPLLDFSVAGAKPGEVVSASQQAAWTLDVHTAVGVERVEVLINGVVVWSSDGVDAPGSRSYEGSLALPTGGWIAARAVGGETVWPAMDSYPFAHTSPVWIGSVGSTHPQARRQAAEELLVLLEVAERRLRLGYAGTDIPRLEARFAEARDRLQQLMAGQ